MKKRLFSLVLCLVMVFSLLPAFSLNAAAAGETETGTITNPDPAQDDTNDLNLTKVLTPGENGTYDLTMNAWATGEVVTNQTVEKIPTDFVVVVDQSGSMDKNDMATGGYTPAGTINLEDVENGRYYYKDGEQYYRVYAKKGYLYQYHAPNTLWTDDILRHTNASLSWFQGNTQEDFQLYGQYYILSPVDNEMCLLNLIIKGQMLSYAFKFDYTDSAGNHKIERPSKEDARFRSATGGTDTYSDHPVLFAPLYQSGSSHKYDYTYGEIDWGIFGKTQWGMFISFPLFSRHIGYTELCYKDLNGEEQVITTTSGKDATQWCGAPETVNGKERYNALTEYENGQRMQYDDLYVDGGTHTRLEALQTALTEFADTIANETDSFGAVDNRISIVGFSSDGFNNNELLTNTADGFSVEQTSWTNYNGSSHYSLDGYAHDGIQYGDATSDDYAKALVNATNGNVGTVNPAITEAINGITAHGGTEPQTGLDMAYQVLANRGEGEGKDTYAYRSEDKLGETTERNKVVIFFTDGQPGNYDYSNQYAAANAVVEKAKPIKDLGATIFSIGVFGESDGNPLTQILQDENGNYAGPLNSAQPAYEYYLGWVDTIQVQGSYYYLARQWRPGDAANYGERANDTIFDYMSVVSSNYPEAEHFITAAWLNGNHQGTYLQATNGVRGTAEATNKYYRMASNQATLIDAFLMAATSTSETYTSGTAVLVDKDAIFKDKVNLADFDIANATYTVQIEPVAMVGNELVRDTSREVSKPVDGAKVPSTGEITYTDFDYSTSYVTSIHPGARLIVTINGLAPKKAGGTLKSNADTDNEHYAAGIYGKGLDTPAVQIASPTLDLSTVAATKTYVIDYNAKTKLATESHQLVAADNNANGVFAKSADKGPYDVTYQLNAGEQNGEMTTVNNNQEYRATINSAYTTVDTAMVYGKPYDLDAEAFADKAGWTKIVTVPASSVYYDDSFTEENAQVLEHPGDVVDQTGTFNGSNSHIFTFYGTGIDVYCTTIDNGGYVSARVYQGNTTSGTAEGTVTVKNQSQGAYYNTPTVHFADLTPGYHTVWIYANENANYQIDGVRVYNPVQAGTTAAEELAKTDEANANYFNLHDLLLDTTSSTYTALSKEDYEKLEDADAAAVSGVLYLDNADKICLQSNDENGKAQLIFNSEFNLYEKNSPINEIYLQTTEGQPQGVAFQLANYPVTGANEKVYLGVSAPKGSGKVVINGHDLPVTSSVDQYYDITEWIATEGATKGVVSIKTSTSDTNLISITNLKITRVTMEQVTGQNPPADAANNSNSLNSYRRLAFAPMTTATVEAIAEETVPELFAIDPETTEDPGTPVTPENPDTPDQPDDPKPVWNDGVNSVQTILKTLFQYLLNSLNSLFSGLGKW